MDTTNDRLNIEDLFFTRTDPRGVIQSGNEVFQRVSVYPWEDLIGAPHKVVRHPEMPKGVFYLLWKTIGDGQPIGAYVMNKAQDGVPYWVFATLLPLDNGYISVRLKPSADHLGEVIPIYEAALKAERAGEVTPEQSADMIVKAIKEMGYADYTDFYSFALRDETMSRDKAMGKKSEPALHSLGTMFKSVRELEKRAVSVESTFHKTHQIPYNMRLQAGRLEGSDGPISVISANHRLMTQSLEENLKRFSAESSLGADAIRMTIFKMAVSQLVDDLKTVYALEENTVDADGKRKDLELLSELQNRYRQEALRDVRALSDAVNRFGNRCRDMRRMMSGLELTRIMCKIERSKFDGDHSGLDEIVNRLADAQDSLSHHFDEILNAVSNVLVLSEGIQRGAQYDTSSRDAA